MKDVITGLTIFLKYLPDGEVAAKHDVLRAGQGLDEKIFSEQELVKLDEAGWRNEGDYWEKFV